MMESIVSKICKRKREEVAVLRREGIGQERRTGIRPFRGALLDRQPAGLIAELKKASPSKGIIRPDFDPAELARAYEQGGAHCLSVLTDRDFFQGSVRNLELAREATSLPVLRKDFMIDPVQIDKSYHMGADAILLIVAILEQPQLEALYSQAKTYGLDVLVEVHDEVELERALATDADMIGINNRNLNDFSVTLATTERLARMVPAGKILVSESGIFTRADIDRVAAAGANAVLVGESLMRENNVAAAARKLLAGDAA